MSPIESLSDLVTPRTDGEGLPYDECAICQEGRVDSGHIVELVECEVSGSEGGVYMTETVRDYDPWVHWHCLQGVID